MFRVYAKNEIFNTDFRIFFDLNGGKYTYTIGGDVPLDTDIVLTDSIDAVHSANSINLYVMELFHNYENQVNVINQNKHPDVYVLTNAVGDYGNRVIFNDFLFNRTKAYYSQFPFSADTDPWYHAGPTAYMTPYIAKRSSAVSAEFKTKIFLAPNKTYRNIGSRNIVYRPKLVDFLKKYSDFGFIGDIHNDPLMLLLPHSAMPLVGSIERVQESAEKFELDERRSGYTPAHNEYYNSTFISIYCETVEFGSSIVVTEKTYDPLIKGHFILPFSCAGFVDYLKTQGFCFPDCIDYSYDSVTDDNKRYQCYQEEAQRLLSVGLDIWKQMWQDNYKLILHNRRVFHSKPYHTLDFSKIML